MKIFNPDLNHFRMENSTQTDKKAWKTPSLKAELDIRETLGMAMLGGDGMSAQGDGS